MTTKNKTRARDSKGQFKKSTRKKTGAKKRKRNTTMAETAVVNPRRKTRSDKGKKRKKGPRRYGAAKRKSTKRRRNPAAPNKYSSGGYQRRPNPSMFDLDTWKRIAPAATAGDLLARWAVKMAGPFEPDASGVPVPGVKHALAIAIIAEVGGKFVGQILGGRAETDYAQIAALGYGGSLFIRRRFMRDNAWLNANISLEGDVLPAGGGTMGADTYTDAAGNQYIRTASGWQLSGEGQGDWHYGQIELPEDAAPGDVIQTEEGEMYEVMAGADGNLTLGAFYQGAETDADVAYELEAPVDSLPGGGMTGFEESSPLGDFQTRSPLGMARSRAAHGANSFGYTTAA